MPTGKRRSSRRHTASDLEEVVRKEATRVKRRRRKVSNGEEAATQPNTPIGRRRKRHVAESSTNVIILAMSPKAANILRSMLGKARHDEPELAAIAQELTDQLGGNPERTSKKQRAGR